MKDIRLKEILKLYTKEDLWNYNQEKLEQLAMKDHEIEVLKNKKAEELTNFLKESNAIKNAQNKKAIECLEEIITILENDPHEIFKGCEDYYEGRTLIDAYYVEKYIDQKISELKEE